MLNKIVLAGIAITAAVGLAGCEYNEPGTTAAYSACHKALLAQGLDDGPAKTTCVAQNQIDLKYATIERNGGKDAYGVQVYLTNSLNSYFVTSYRVIVIVGESPNIKSAYKDFTNRFLQPGQTEPAHLFWSDLGDIKDGDFTADTKWSLQVSATKGLEIKSGLNF